MLVEVQCNKCGWSKEEQDPLDWYNKKCPKCSESIIIDRKDMDAYVKLKKLKDRGIVITGKEKIKEQKGIKIKFDSSKTFTCFKCGEEIAIDFMSPLQKNVCIFCDFKIPKK